MQKGVAVPVVIALMLGVIIIALLGYWFFKTGGKFSGAALEATCRGEAVKYCTKNPAGTWPATGDCSAYTSQIGTSCPTILS